jgi:hypothetical protein
MGTIDVDDADVVARVERWLMSPEGRAATEREMRRCGLPSAFDADLARLVLHAARRATDVESVPAWTSHVLRRRALDLVRSPSVQRRDDAGENAAALDDASFDAVLTELEVGALRAALFEGSARPAVVSAALTYLGVTMDELVPGRDVPWPGGSSDALDGAHWAGLHYSGHGDCFATPDTAAVRQRRSRRIAEVKAALVAGYEITSGR